MASGETCERKEEEDEINEDNSEGGSVKARLSKTRTLFRLSAYELTLKAALYMSS